MRWGWRQIMSTFVIIDRALVTTDSICLTMRLESSELGCGSLTSVGVDLDQAQYNHAGSEPQSPTVDETKKELYVLAIMDELTGTPIRMATEKDVSIDLSGFDVDSINRSLINCPTPSRTTSPLTPKGGAGYSGEGFHAFHRQKSLQALLANAKGGPACDHCGVKESPQWRKGPEDKPILCNACGTRYRRTNQFAPLTSVKEPECSKKRLFQSMVRVADDKVGNENKAPRLLSL